MTKVFTIIFVFNLPTSYIFPIIINLNNKHTLKIFGSVRYVRQVPSPPILNDAPLFSIYNSIKLVAKIPTPAVKESPIAAITSMSPGLKRWTELGTIADLLSRLDKRLDKNLIY